MAPEVLLLGYDSSKSWFDNSTTCNEALALLSSKPKSDIWSLGMILLEMALGIELLSESRTKLCNTLRKVMSWIHASGSAVERIVQEIEVMEQWKVIFIFHIFKKKKENKLEFLTIVECSSAFKKIDRELSSSASSR